MAKVQRAGEEYVRPVCGNTVIVGGAWGSGPVCPGEPEVRKK